MLFCTCFFFDVIAFAMVASFEMLGFQFDSTIVALLHTLLVGITFFHRCFGAKGNETCIKLIDMYADKVCVCNAYVRRPPV